jgi:hypothetical protein
MSNISTIKNDGIEYPVFQGTNGQYYIVDNIKYDIRFPIEWALDARCCIRNNIECEASRSGPKHCNNCKEYGSINGVHAFYCSNCNLYVYEGKRGGLGLHEGDTITDSVMQKTFLYLANVTKDEIGGV